MIDTVPVAVHAPVTCIAVAACSVADPDAVEPVFTCMAPAEVKAFASAIVVAPVDVTATLPLVVVSTLDFRANVLPAMISASPSAADHLVVAVRSTAPVAVNLSAADTSSFAETVMSPLDVTTRVPVLVSAPFVV